MKIVGRKRMWVDQVFYEELRKAQGELLADSGQYVGLERLTRKLAQNADVKVLVLGRGKRSSE